MIRSHHHQSIQYWDVPSACGQGRRHILSQNVNGYFFSCRQICKELQDILAQDPYPKTRLPNSQLPESVLRGLNHFGLVTHGFGAPAINAALNAFQSYLTELMKCTEAMSLSSSNSSRTPGGVVKNSET